MDAPISRPENQNHETPTQLDPPRPRRPDRRQTFFEPVNLDERLPAVHTTRTVGCAAGCRSTITRSATFASNTKRRWTNCSRK